MEEQLSIDKNKEAKNLQTESEENFSASAIKEPAKEPRQNNKLKQLFTLVLVFVVLLLLVIFVGNPKKERQAQKQSLNRPLIEDFEGSRISKIEFLKEDPVRLVLNNDKWRLDGTQYFAESSQVNQLLTALEQAEGNIVSTNQENFSDFDLAGGQDTGLSLYDKDGQILAELEIGKAGPAYPGSYVKYRNQNEVYLIDQNLTAFANKETSDWRSRQILSFDPALVESVSIKRLGYKEIIIEKDLASGDWLVTMPYEIKPTDQALAEQVINGLAALKAGGFARDKTLSDVGLSGEAVPYLEVKIDLRTGEQASVQVGDLAEEQGIYYVINPEDTETIYQVNQSTIENIDQDRENFRLEEETPAQE